MNEHPLSSCEYYDTNKSISDILTISNEAYRVSTAIESIQSDVSLVEFVGSDLLTGQKPVSVLLRVVRATDEASVAERQEMHDLVSFLMDYADRPPGLGFFGFDRSQCSVVPAVVPGVEYWVFLDDGRISLFEPVTETSRLGEWIAYFLESRFPNRADND